MSDKKIPKILMIPMDNRPVCCDLPLSAANIFDGLNVFVPDRTLLGDLNTEANIKELLKWTKKIIKNNDIDIVIVSLDTIAYGGLVSSRRTSLTFDEIKNNVDNFLKVLKKKNKTTKIYAFSSIMRISNNNINEEEKSYWDKYGRNIFRYSYLAHKLLRNYDIELETEMIQLAKIIPFEVIDDYLNTRKRNFDMNSYYIDLTKNGVIDRIIFAQDDAAEFGLNVEEKELLWKQAVKEIISDKVAIKTGADEMALALLSRALCDYYEENPKINPLFFNEKSKKIISRYEDVSIEQSVNKTIELCGGEISYTKSDIQLFVNAPNKIQDEICLGIYEDEKSVVQADLILEHTKNSSVPFAIADVKNANGADNYLSENFIKNIKYSDDFYGFGAWNTTGNTLGTVISTAIIKFLAKKFGIYNELAFRKSQYIRLLDDWAYQSNVRKILRMKGDTKTVEEEMAPYLEKISNWLEYRIQTSYSFPWDRTFEIEIKAD